MAYLLWETSRLSCRTCRTYLAPLTTNFVLCHNLGFLQYILHDWDDESCLKLWKNCCQALLPHGKVIALDHVLPEIFNYEGVHTNGHPHDGVQCVWRVRKDRARVPQDGLGCRIPESGRHLQCRRIILYYRFSQSRLMQEEKERTMVCDPFPTT